MNSLASFIYLFIWAFESKDYQSLEIRRSGISLSAAFIWSYCSRHLWLIINIEWN